MRTKTLQARHLHAGDEIVDGGDGVRRTAHRINEITVSREAVSVKVRARDGGFETRPYRPRDPVRIKHPDAV